MQSRGTNKSPDTRDQEIVQLREALADATVERLSLLMSPGEIREVAGGYRQQSKQLEELHRQGFWRARRSKVTGDVILERAHYEAVCAGVDAARAAARKRSGPEPRVRD